MNNDLFLLEVIDNVINYYREEKFMQKCLEASGKLSNHFQKFI